MISTMTQQNKMQGFFIKYKKWFIALIGLQLIPVVFLVILFGGTAMYLFMNNDTNFHPYKSYIVQGVKAGHSDGAKNYVFGKHAPWTLWLNYEYNTDKLKEKVALEKEEYLAQFPESERGVKLAEMKLNNVKLPLQLELDKRFKTGLDFYADYVQQRVKRESFASDAEYQEALQVEAWKAGYAFGYNHGLDGDSYDTAHTFLE